MTARRWETFARQERLPPQDTVTNMNANAARAMLMKGNRAKRNACRTLGSVWNDDVGPPMAATAITSGSVKRLKNVT